MYEKLPQELKERGSFCLWKYEERDGRMTKVPYQTSGLRADFTDKATFTDYATANSIRDKYDGIGIGVFDDICAIDIDHCLANEVLSDTRTKKQTIVIYWNFIGVVEIPDEQEKTA